MEGNISSRTTNIQIYPTTTALRSSSKYHRASLSHTPQRGSSHTESTGKNQNQNEQPAASSSSLFARRKPTPSLTVPSSSSLPTKNVKANIIRKKTPFHGSTEVILQDKKKKKQNSGTANDTENKKKKNTNNKVVVAAVVSSSTRRGSSSSTYRLRRSPPSERKAASKMMAKKKSFSLQQMPPIEIVPTSTSTTTRSSSSSRNHTSRSHSRVSKSSSSTSANTLSHRLKLLNCFGQKHEQDENDENEDDAVDDACSVNHHPIRNKKKQKEEKTTATYLRRRGSMAQGVVGVPTIVTNTDDKIPQHNQFAVRNRRCRSPTSTTVQGDTTTTTTTTTINTNNKNASIASTAADTVPSARASSAAAATATTLIRSTTRSTVITPAAAASSSSSAPGAKYPRAQQQQPHPAVTRAETELETETIVSTDADTILSELKAEEVTLQQLLWKLNQEQHAFDDDNDTDNNIDVDGSYQRKENADDGTIDPRQQLQQIPESRMATLPPLTTSSSAYLPKNLLPSPSKLSSSMKTSLPHSSSFSSIPPPPPPLLQRILSSSHHLGVPQSSSSKHNKKSVGSTASLSEAATTLGTPTAGPRPVSSSPARTAATSGFSLPGNSIMSGYSISDGDGDEYDTDLYATDLSSFAGFGGASGSTTTNRSHESDVVTSMAAHTIALQQQEQLAQQQQQRHGTTSTIITTPRCHFCGEGHWIYQCPFMNPLSYQERDSAQCSTVAGGYNTDGYYTDHETDDDATRQSDVFDTILLES